MALPPIIDLIKSELPHLTSADDTRIEIEILKVMYYLQTPLKKTDLDVEDETTYKAQEKLLVAYLTALYMLEYKGLKDATTIGSSGSSSTIPTYLKSAKADVVEATFDQADLSKSSIFARKTTDILDVLAKKTCETARLLGINLPFCGAIPYDEITPFIYIPPGC